MYSQRSVSSLDEATHQQKNVLMLFDLSIRGHHPSYIHHLIQFWYEHDLPGDLAIVVSPRFLQEHQDVVNFIPSYCRTVNFIAIDVEEEALLSSRKSSLTRAFRNFQEWQLLCKYARALQASECLIMYFDTYQLPLALGFQAPCPLSGIYFRPTFHYHSFTNALSSKQEPVQQWREKILLARILQHPQLKTLFCLDPFAVKHLNQFQNKVEAVYLPDPVATVHRSELPVKTLADKLGIELNRVVFLLFGSLTERKGIYQLLEALESLSSELCQKICLLMVGESKIEAQLRARIEAVSQAKPLQILTRYEFVPDQEVHAYFELADVVLAPYQRHVGMSGILLLAAAAQKPVLSSDYGLMGEMVQRYQLGLAVDSTQPEEIAQGLTQILHDGTAKIGDRASMQTFAEQNSAERFASVIFQYCLSNSRNKSKCPTKL